MQLGSQTRPTIPLTCIVYFHTHLHLETYNLQLILRKHSPLPHSQKSSGDPSKLVDLTLKKTREVKHKLGRTVGTGSFGGEEDVDMLVTKKASGGKKMSDVKAAASAGFDKALAAAAVGAKKVKTGISTGIKRVKKQYQKKYSS